ncbi:hypothetical protein P152DRAFT_198925 [Eremomyces bilateralis CBS 781.70]|uniref:Fungal N-terminal domain-containing protein n=1 Tax=Eremomyces bilateralis CBS 781.70 TaxID=1392243 RepID=A0A6G1GCT1_9PEZI|nr:uncharacterized protein P152DRAFT_198925 [Eremomyces bilateralis CBS 781.70]KAF1815844.1 hypothetical protein P152DRAFT_198925 [Eremomyces bilateralis CBS 781.70]
MENRESILQMVRWGTRLSLALFSVSGASGDLNRLAKKVNKFSLVLRQVGSRFQEESISSPQSARAVTHILHQAQGVFGEIETIVPQAAEYVRDTSTSWTSVKVGTTWQWDEAAEDKAHYLLEHLEALALTLQVMLQTFYTVKITVWARQQTTQNARDAVSTERLQLQSLIIEQQLCILNTHQLHLDYRLDNVPSRSQVLTVLEERQPCPQHLVSYQEESLVAIDVDNTESQRLEVVRKVAGSYIDELLRRWTRLEEIEQDIRQEEFQTRAQQEREMQTVSRRASQQPSVEEDDEEHNLKHPVPKNCAPGPLLTPMSETHYAKAVHKAQLLPPVPGSICSFGMYTNIPPPQHRRVCAIGSDH